jgi:hypothetical protein
MHLPHPANELQARLAGELNDALLTIRQLTVFFHGHEKDTTTLDSLTLLIHRAAITTANLDWPHTNTSEEWKA